MVTLLLGSDILAKKQYISNTARKLKADVETFTDVSSLPPITQLFEQQLFGAPKIVVLETLWKQFDDKVVEQILKVGESKRDQLYLIEETLDKRKKNNQEFLKDKRVQVLQLDAPVGTAASNEWIKKFAKENNINIEPAAGLALAHALLIDEDATLDVARAQNELAKLNSFAGGKTITSVMVSELTESISGVDVFELLNAIATKNKKLALQMLEQHFATETTDEKTTAIKMTALLADQFRSLLIATDATNRNLPDAKVLELTGWKSGRLFIMKKLSRNFQVAQLKQSLAKLENLDKELKSSTMPPHVVLDLIIADM